MGHLWMLSLVLPLLAALGTTAAEGESREPLVIGTGPQFVHDSYIVDNYWVPGHSRAIVERRFHPPAHHDANPVLEGERFSYFSVYRDAESGTFRLWYQIFNPDTIAPDAPKDLPRYGIAYAESDDGVTWRLPTIGRHTWRGSTSNNVVWMGVKDNGAAGGFVLELPERDRRGFKYAMLYQTHSGLRLVGSRDGIDWDKGSDVRIKHLQSDTFNALAYDPDAERYFIYGRARNIYRNYEDDADQGAVRRVAVMSATDLWGEWSDEPSTILVPDEIDTERGFTFFYGMPVRHYGGVFWGFLWPFQMNTVILGELAFSRNGIDWDRLPTRPRLLEPGPEGTWDGGQVIITPHWVEVGDEWWIYYTGQDGPHNRPVTNSSALGLLKIRKEGFISRYGPALGGRLCTRPLIWPGGDLVVNASAAGNLRARVVDPMRRPIDGFTYEDSDLMAGDSVSHPIRWGGRSLDELEGRPVRIEFELRDAHLYTFRATGEPLGENGYSGLASKLRPASPASDATRPAAARSTEAGSAPEMEPAERPEDMVAAVEPDAGTSLPETTGKPLVHFTFDAVADGAVRDEGVMGLALKLGQPGQEQETTPTLVEGQSGRALRFDGQDDAASGRVHAALPERGVLHVVFRPDQKLDQQVGVNKYLFHLFGDTKNREILMFDHRAGRLVYQSMRLNKEPVTVRSSGGFEAGRWYRVSVVFGPTGTRLFVDGEPRDEWGSGHAWSDLKSPTLYVGSVPAAFGPGYSFPGVIDDLRVEVSGGDAAAAGSGERLQDEDPAGDTADAALRALASRGRGIRRRPGEATLAAAFREGRLAELRVGGRDVVLSPHDEPLWVLELAKPGEERSVRVASAGESEDGFRVSAIGPAGRDGTLASQRWTISDASGRRVGNVEARAVASGEADVDFHLALDGFDGRFIVRKAWYPQFPLARIGEEPRDDYLLVPSAHGQIYRDVHAQATSPWGRGGSDILRAVHRTRYPSKFGNLQMQFYGDDEAAGGLLMMTPDTQRRIKDLVVDRSSRASPLRARFGHHLTAEVPLEGRVELDYPVRLRWVEGGWYDAGRAYREWAVTQAWAQPEQALGRRADLPDWFAGLPSWVRIPADPAVPFEEKTGWPPQWVEAVGGPMGVHWYGWNEAGGPFNYAFPRYTPPHPRFDSLVQQYHDAGLKVMPYTNARLVDMDVPEVWSRYERAVVRNRSGDVSARETWPFYADREQAEAARARGKEVREWTSSRGTWFHVMHDFAVGWAGSETWRGSIRERATRLFVDHGVDAVYQDQLGVYPMVQHATEEAPGDPTAWQRHEEALYEGLREDLRAEGVQPLFIAEYLNEALLPHIAGGLTVAGISDATREPVPLWNTVYHAHFAAIGWQDDPSELRTPPLYLRSRLIPLVWGSQMGWISYTPPELIKNHPAIVDAYRDAVTLRRENPSALGWGEMLRPPAIEGHTSEPPAHAGEGGALWQWPAILAGCFRDAEDPSRAVAVFANWTDAARTATATIDTAAFRGAVTARGAGIVAHAAASEPLRLSLDMPPMSIRYVHLQETRP